jgi:hypothetical protein
MLSRPAELDLGSVPSGSGVSLPRSLQIPESIPYSMMS